MKIIVGKEDPKWLIAGGLVGLGGCALIILGERKIRKVADMYNYEQYKKTSSVKLDFGIQRHGIGFALKF